MRFKKTTRDEEAPEAEPGAEPEAEPLVDEPPEIEVIMVKFGRDWTYVAAPLAHVLERLESGRFVWLGNGLYNSDQVTRVTSTKIRSSGVWPLDPTEVVEA